MKKITTFLMLLLSFVSISSIAQNTNCNAEFNVAYQNGNTVQFNPVVTNIPGIQHFWEFGDGGSSTLISPVHTYTSGVVFTAQHSIVYALNGIQICSDSFHRVIQVQNTCILTANFYAEWDSLSTVPNSYFFINTTTPQNTTDSVRWTFGDGSSSNDFNPHHSYSQAGTYTVCLRVQQRNSAGTLTNCVSEICHTITVANPAICNLAAGFYSYPDTISTPPLPNLYHFVNTSTPLNPIDSVRWTFGDGTFSNELNPSHSYQQPGTYIVCLRIQKRESNGGLTNCIREICHTVVVINPTICNLVANFSYALVAGAVFTYHFENGSVPLHNTDSIRWTFGDGTSSNQANPNHTYTAAGTYTVCMRIQQRNPNGGLTDCIREVCHTVVVVNPPTCNLVASFYSYRDTISTSPLPNLYHFVNTSTPLNNTDSVRWTFGDGASSNDVNPTHSYAQTGTYTVCLRVQKREPNGGLTNCIREVCHTVVVTPVCNIQAHFTWTADAVNPRVIHFTNTSLSPTAAATATWSFGDGSSSTAWNPVHAYAHAGIYYVCLNIQSGANCISHFCDSVIVHELPVSCTQQSNFNFFPSNINNQTFYFRPAYINTTWQYTWTFGDGTGSHDIDATHHYTQPGNYTACLTVYRDANCASTTCKHVTVSPQVNCANISVIYSYQRDPVLLNKLYFYAISGISLTDQTWTITKLPANSGTAPVTLHQNNPTYLFQDTGYYRVCLRAVTAGGCVKEYCQEIYIQQVVTPGNCNLQVYPNPSTSFIYFTLFLGQPQTIHTYIYNTMNVLVQEQQQPGVTGTNTVSVGIANLTAGTYILKVIHGNDICYAQFVKL